MNIESTNRYTWAFVIIAMLGITPLCYAGSSSDKTSIEEVKKEAHDFIQALKSYTADHRDEAIQKTKVALDNLDKRTDELEKRIKKNWNKMDKAARKDAQASLDALRKRRAQVAEWYDRLKGSSADAWGHMQKGFSDAYGSLYDAWEKSEKKFGSDK